MGGMSSGAPVVSIIERYELSSAFVLEFCVAFLPRIRISGVEKKVFVAAPTCTFELSSSHGDW